MIKSLSIGRDKVNKQNKSYWKNDGHIMAHVAFNIMDY